MTYPNLIIAGAPKSGTTSLFDYLIKHPEVEGSSIKETCYFMDSDYPLFKKNSNYYTHGLQGYEKYFSHVGNSANKIICEATPDYMYQECALKRIREIPGNVSIVFILRHPADRAYSLFRFAQNNIGVVSKGLTFAKFLEDLDKHPEKYRHRVILKNVIEHGVYIDYLQRWKNIYKDHIKLYLFEDMIKDPESFMKSVARDFGIDSETYRSIDYQNRNQTVVIANQRLHRLYIRLRKTIVLRQFFFHRQLSSIYRKINYRAVKGNPKTEEDIEKLAYLCSYYRESIALLSESFNVDLASWLKREVDISGNSQ